MTEVQIPRLYETESVPLEEKIIFQRYDINSVGFFWLISELDPSQNLAFGYANARHESLAAVSN